MLSCVIGTEGDNRRMMTTKRLLTALALAATLAAPITAAHAETPGPVAKSSQDATVEPISSSLQHDYEGALKKADATHFVTLNVENDMFAPGNNDENYTSGVRLTYHEVGAPLPAFTETLDKIVPTFRATKATSIYYSIGQNIYTPKNIQVAAPQPKDRPWAGYLYASAGMAAVKNNRVDEIEASLGVVGPAALGEQAQKTIHKIVNSPRPQGWDNQLKNEPAVMLAWNRRYPERYAVQLPQFLDSTWTATAEPNIGVTLGNVYTYANAGLSFRLTPFEGRFQDAPIKVRPAMPGTGAFIVPDDVVAWQIFGGIEARAVAQNIFLDGNTFADSPSVDKKPFVYDATAGVSTAYGKTRVSYALVYRSKEFDGQEDPSLFGTISLGYRF